MPEPGDKCPGKNERDVAFLAATVSGKDLEEQNPRGSLPSIVKGLKNPTTESTDGHGIRAKDQPGVVKIPYSQGPEPAFRPWFCYAS